MAVKYWKEYQLNFKIGIMMLLFKRGLNLVYQITEQTVFYLLQKTAESYIIQATNCAIDVGSPDGFNASYKNYWRLDANSVRNQPHLFVTDTESAGTLNEPMKYLTSQLFTDHEIQAYFNFLPTETPSQIYQKPEGYGLNFNYLSTPGHAALSTQEESADTRMSLG